MCYITAGDIPKELCEIFSPDCVTVQLERGDATAGIHLVHCSSGDSMHSKIGDISKELKSAMLGYSPSNQ